MRDDQLSVITTEGRLTSRRFALRVHTDHRSAHIGCAPASQPTVEEPTRCNRCQLLVPYSDIAKKIRAAGFRNGTIFATYFPHDLAGNFRSTFPDARIVSIKFPAITRSLGADGGQCLIIWMPAPWGNVDTGTMINRTNQYFKSDIPFQNAPLKTLYFKETPAQTEKANAF